MSPNDLPGAAPFSGFFPPMLATSATEPFDSPDHWFEVKWDGVRVLAFCNRNSTRLFSRTGRAVGGIYPELEDLHERVASSKAVIDGEIFALRAGRPSFEQIQQRLGLTRPGDVRRASGLVPVHLACFDLVVDEGVWIGDRPLEERLDRLGEVIEVGGPVVLSARVREAGRAFFDAAKERGLEGMMAKRVASRYVPGRRSRDWIKIKVVRRVDCVVGGFLPGDGSRRGAFGSLLLGVYDGSGGLVYLGNVGTGFDERMLARLAAELDAAASQESPFTDLPSLRGARWVRPVLVCEVEYRELTAARRLRAASFKRLRTDKAPEECLLAEPA